MKKPKGSWSPSTKLPYFASERAQFHGNVTFYPSSYPAFKLPLKKMYPASSGEWKPRGVIDLRKRNCHISPQKAHNPTVVVTILFYPFSNYHWTKCIRSRTVIGEKTRSNRSPSTKLSNCVSEWAQFYDNGGATVTSMQFSSLRCTQYNFGY